MGSLSIWHWLIVLVIVALVFGTKKLGNIGHDLGSAVRGFKKAMSDGDQEEQAIRKQLPPAGTTGAPPPGTARDAEFHDTTSTGARQDDRRS